MIYTVSGYWTKSNTPTLYVKIIPQASNVHAPISCLTPRSCCYIPVAAATTPKSLRGVILCSERGQSRGAFQAIPLEETSPR